MRSLFDVVNQSGRLLEKPDAVITIDNVVDYIRSFGKTSWILGDDIPNIAPPLPRMFFEWRANRIPALEHSANDYRLGALVCSEDFKKGPKLSALSAETRALAQHLNARWYCCYESIAARCHGDSELEVLAREDLFVDDDGKVITQIDQNTKMVYWHRVGTSDTSLLKLDRGSMDRVVGSFSLPAMLAISFMHCKNVHVVEGKSNILKQKCNGKRSPHYKYHILQINPMREVLRREGKSNEVGLKRALHICRGHFKDYRDHGLFGNQRGVYWWPMHVRGTVEAGMVVKDYSISNLKTSRTP